MNSDDGARLRVTLLGTFEVCRGDAVVSVPGTRLRGLLARLALAGGRAVDPGVLLDALWPQDRPSDPVNALQSLVSRLRRVLGDAGAVTQAEAGYRLDVAPDDVDAARFEQLAGAGRDRLRAGDARAAAALLGSAVAIWGEPAAVAAVAPAIAVRLTRAAIDAAADLGEAELALGRAEAAAARLTVLRAEHPADERVAGLLMDALAAQGRQAEALEVYQGVRADLADRLGADPGTALRERHLRLLRDPVPPPAEPARAAPSNLPAALTSFIGRDDDLARIDVLLGTGRLVTVVGPGGAGKTRLALEAGRRHRHEFPGGTWLADLASVTEPAKVGAALLAAIGLRGAALFEGSSRIRSEGGELDVLADQLSGAESLLVVDNCEHLIDAVAHLVAALLRRCAGLRVLATSREPLAVDGEALVPLGPLALPDADAGVEQARRTASTRLFIERAAAVRPGFDVDTGTLGDIISVVRGLDGMPLALELAAARLRTMSLTDLVAGLSDRFRLLTTGSRTAQPRHRTLRAVIAWSWDLLTADERTVAEHISVLPGGVTPESAAAVCPGLADLPEVLAALVDRSLLQLAPDAARYRMLETLREYGVEQLARRGEVDAVRARAAHYLHALVARHDPELRGPGQLAALRAIHAEYDNAIAALRHLCDSGDPAAVPFALSLCWYWQMFGRHGDATYWLGRALEHPAGEPTIERDLARALFFVNRFGDESAAGMPGVGDDDAALRALADRLVAYPELPGFAGALTAVTLMFLEEKDAALAIIQRLIDGTDVWLAGLAHMFRALFAENEGHLEQVRADVDAALDRFGRSGDRWGLATVLPMRALLRQYDGDLDGALADLRAARARAGEFGSLSLNDAIFIDMRWVDLYMRRGEPERAIAMLDSARERAQRVNSAELTMIIRALEAGVRVQLGDLDRAERLIGETEVATSRTRPRTGDHGRALIGSARAWLCVARGDGAGAEAALTSAYAGAVESRDMPILAMVAVTAAGLAQMYGRFPDAALLLGAAARLRGTHDRTDQQVLRLSARARAALGDAAFAEAYDRGWQLDSPTALTRADPARLRRGALPAGDSAPAGEKAQARRA